MAGALELCLSLHQQMALCSHWIQLISRSRVLSLRSFEQVERDASAPKLFVTTQRETSRATQQSAQCVCVCVCHLHEHTPPWTLWIIHASTHTGTQIKFTLSRWSPEHPRMWMRQQRRGKRLHAHSCTQHRGDLLGNLHHRRRIKHFCAAAENANDSSAFLSRSVDGLSVSER